MERLLLHFVPVDCFFLTLSFLSLFHPLCILSLLSGFSISDKIILLDFVSNHDFVLHWLVNLEKGRNGQEGRKKNRDCFAIVR